MNNNHPDEPTNEDLKMEYEVEKLSGRLLMTMRSPDGTPMIILENQPYPIRGFRLENFEEWLQRKGVEE